MKVETVCEQFGVREAKDKVRDYALSLSEKEGAEEIASLLFDVHYALEVLTSHNGDTTNPEISFLMSTVVSTLTSVDRVIGAAETYHLTDDVVDILVRFSTDTSVLLSAFSIDVEGEEKQ